MIIAAHVPVFADQIIRHLALYGDKGPTERIAVMILRGAMEAAIFEFNRIWQRCCLNEKRIDPIGEHERIALALPEFA